MIRDLLTLLGCLILLTAGIIVAVYVFSAVLQVFALVLMLMALLL